MCGIFFVTETPTTEIETYGRTPSLHDALPIWGEIWTAAACSGYVGKPRPVAIVQDDRFDATDSVTVCAFTTDPTEAPLFRLRIDADGVNGLRESCSLMVDKITTIPRSRLGERIGRLDDEQMLRLGRAILVFFGLAG